ncbi:hypothetical protein EKK58_00175 [Candidatus Dependentiae bacterium]|nr:MAG: hypothetical protein EKK58_00175 [Candidatus Dependentiae bacterium]
MGAHIQGMHDLEIPDHARAFFDPDKTRKWVQESAVQGLHEYLNKLETPDFKLQVKDVHVHDPSKHFSLQEQKQATLDRHDLTQAVKGTVELVNKKTGAVVDTKKGTTLAHIPWVTDRNTVVYNGSEYNITSQQRLKPGVYARVKDTGDIEAHVNVKAGTGSGGKVIFFPDKALFIYQVGTTRIKLYGLLHALGISDSEMEQAWGKEIFAKNKAAYEGNEAEKMYDKLFTY